MLFYTFLFIASIIAALVILRIYNAIMSVGKTIYTAILPSSKNPVTDHLENVRISTTINETPTPWGWKDHSTPAHQAQLNPATPDKQTPWGWPGNNNEIREHKPAAPNSNGGDLNSYLNNHRNRLEKEKEQRPTVGWPYREEKFDFAGKEYKVTRKAKRKKADFSSSGKPWGW